VGTAPLPRFRSGAGGRAHVDVLIVALGAEVGWLMADPHNL
jgi:hypothetical protein